MPCTKRTDYKTKDGTVLALGDVVVFQVIILSDLFLFCSFESVALILKRAGDVNYCDLVVVDDHNIRTGAVRDVGNLFVQSNFTRSDRVGEAVDDSVVTISDISHVFGF